jgi:hypothetical protein
MSNIKYNTFDSIVLSPAPQVWIEQEGEAKMLQFKRYRLFL